MIDLQNYGQAIGFEQITVDNTSGGKGFTASKYQSVDISGAGKPLINANVVLVTLEGTAGTNDIRWTIDGTAPTTTVGHLLRAGDIENGNPIVIRGRSNIAKFRAIRTGGTSGLISCTFFVN